MANANPLYSAKSMHAHVAAWNRHKRDMREQRAAAALAIIAADYAANRSNDARFDLCNAIIDLIDNGDAWAEREALMEELGCDEDGNPRPMCQEDYADYLYEQRRDAADERRFAA